MSTITIRQATTKDIDPFVHCINQAYRKKEPGAWTTEEHLLTGDRINNEGVLELLKIDAHLPRLIVAESEETIVGTLEIGLLSYGLTFRDRRTWHFGRLRFIFGISSVSE
jgi:hypothetical protein